MSKPANSKVPKIRFKAFEGGWEEKTFDQCFELLSGQHLSPHQYNVHKTGIPYFTGPSDFTDNPREVTKWTGLSTKLAKRGAVLITVKGSGVGQHAYLELPQVAIGRQLMALESKTTSTRLVFHALPKYQRQFLGLGSGNMIPGLSRTDILTTRIFLPPFTEQVKVAALLSALDRLLGLQQRKHDKLVTLKKAMLQKMFPQPGTTTPEIRFKGFTGPWGEKKLGDVATFINGRAYRQNELLDKGKYRVLRVGNFYTNSAWYYSDMELAEKLYANHGDLLYTWSASFGPHIWHGEKVIYHYHIWKVELKELLCKEFALQLLENDRKRILETSSGSTMVHITKEGMEKKCIVIPLPEEQQKIGRYFRTLDELIAQHAFQLAKLKQLKAACLERMFV